MNNQIPEGCNTLTPQIVFKDCRKAIEFYKKAFDAKEKVLLEWPGDKSIMHASIQVGNSTIMMSDENQHCKSSETIGASPVSFYVYVEDADKAFKKATDAGAEIAMPVADMFWGDRCGQVKDPFGYLWMIGTHIKDLTPEEIRKGAEMFCAEMAKR